MTTRYPVILAHGIAVNDKLPFISFWGRIPEVLGKAGVEVHLGNTDAWGSVRGNAEKLQETIERVLASGGHEKVNIIAHSKGGVDSRYLISTMRFAPKVASLTTVCTPHRGAELADLIVSREEMRHPIVRKATRVMTYLYGETNPDPYVIAETLSTRGMAEFNRDNPDSDRVYYQSFHSVMNGPLDDMNFWFTYNYIRKFAGANDGVVSAASSRWGESSVLITGRKAGISHTEIVDFKRAKVSGVDVPGVYLSIAEGLSRRGL